MALKVAEVLIRWRSQGAQDVEASTKRMSQSLTALGDKAKAVGGVLSVGLTAPLTLIGKQAVDAASDLNEAMSQVETVFGSTSDQMIRFTRTASSQLGQSQQAALSAAGALGALFDGVGLTNQQMADFSSSLLTAAADLGSFYNVDPGQALENLRSGLVGEAEPLRRFGILINEAAVETKALELGLIAAGDEMTEAQKVQARYALIMDQLGAASGDFARTSGGLANSQRILAARLQDVRAEIGTYLLPYALRAAEVVSTLLDRFQSLDDRTKGLAVALGAAGAAAGPVLVIFGQLVSSAGALGPLIGALTGPIGLVVAAIAGLALAFKTDFLGIRTALQPIIDGVGETLTRMVRFFQAAKDRGLTPFRLAFRTLIVALSERLGGDHPVVEFLQGFLRNGERLAGWITSTGIPKVREFFRLFTSGDFAGAGNVVGQLFEDIKGGWDRTIGPWIEDRKAQGAELIKGLAEGARDAVTTELIPRFVDAFTGLAAWLNSDGLPGIVDRMVTGGAELIGGLFKGLWDNKQQIWDFFSQTLFPGILKAMVLGPVLLVNTGIGIVRGLWSGASQVWETQLGPWFEERKNATLAFFQDASDWLLAKGQDISDGLLKGIEEKANEIFAWFNSLGAKISSVIEGASTWLLAKGTAIVQGMLDGIVQKYLDVAAFFGNLKDSILGALPDDIGTMLYDTGLALIQGLWDGATAKWDEFTLWLESLKPSLPQVSGGEVPITEPNRRPGKDQNIPEEARALGGPLSRRYTLVGEYGPELLINKQLVMPHGASMSRIAAMGGMANGGTMWGAWLARQDRDTRLMVRAMRGAGTLNAANRRELMGDIAIAEDGSIVPASFYRDREPAATRRARQQHERNSDALNRANDYGDRTGDYSRRDRVLAREARNGTLAEGGLSRQEREYIINNYGSINVYADDPNVGRKIAETIATRRR